MTRLIAIVRLTLIGALACTSLASALGWITSYFIRTDLTIPLKVEPDDESL